MRITITADVGRLYFSLKKLHINVSTQGNAMAMNMYGRTVANYNAGADTWTTYYEAQTLA
ncbi:MAG: hypothetical protein HUJ56_04935 [Erysipelotrichaceae bacterium]|nr:hypothetical protein [Erysipelotrichaceae bacterium]